MARSSRDRVTIDLRGIGERLRAHAVAHRMTAAALVRRTLLAMLDDDAGAEHVSCNGTAGPSSDRVVKVTLRLSATHAVALATRARAADVSQGAYVAGLMDGTPPHPLPPDHSHAVAALVGSTDQLAAMGADLNAFIRLLRLGSSTEVERYRARVMSLADDVRGHLALAAPLAAELKSTRRAR